MILKAINLKRLALKTAVAQTYIGVRKAYAPSFKSFRDKAKQYAPNPLGVGLYGTSLLATGKIAKYSYKASQIYGSAEIPIEVLSIIQKSYQSEAFYKASWQVKSRILAKRIVQSPTIQRNVGEAGLSAIIYEIMQRNKNRQGNEDLAVEITDKAKLEFKEPEIPKEDKYRRAYDSRIPFRDLWGG